MYIEMEILARERYDRVLREAAEMNRHRTLVAKLSGRARGPRHMPFPRLRQR
jgi:hypothetical protein